MRAADLLRTLKSEIDSSRPPFWIHHPVPQPPRPRSESGRLRARHRRALEVWRVAEDCRCTLVSLCGEFFDERQLAPFADNHRRRVRPSKTDEFAGRMHSRLLSEAAKFVRVRRLHHAKTGDRLDELLSTLGSDMGSMMHDRAASTAYVPVLGRRVAEPPEESSVVPLLGHLPPPLAELYATPSRLLRSRAEVEDILRRQNKCFSRFMGPQSEYAVYLSRPEVRPLWDLKPVELAHGRCTFAAVEKRGTTDLRKILQVCPMNDAMKSVEEAIECDPAYGLQGTGAVTQIVSRSDRLVAALLDQSNAFTYVEVPEWWRAYQAGPSIRAKHLPAQWLVAQGLDPYDGEQKLAPQYRRLPMGHTHSVFLLMTMNKAAVRAAAAEFPHWRVLLLNDTESLDSGCDIDHRTLAVYIHVDDFGVISVSTEVCQIFALAIRRHLEATGFHVKYTPCSEVTRYIGLELRHTPARWIPAGERLAVISAVLCVLASRRWIPLDAMRTALGQFVSLALLWRPALSIPQASYRFVNQCVGKAMVWPSVRLELQQMHNVLPLLVYDIGAPACELVLSQDAAGPTEDGCPTGAFCIGCSAPPLDQIEAVLARREVRGRKHIAPDAAPIELRHGPSGLEGRWTSMSDGSQVAKEPSTDPTSDVVLAIPHDREWIPLVRTVLPSSWFASAQQWELLLARRWRKSVHINVGELRASTTWIKIFCAAVGPKRLRVLDITDSMVANGILARGRASAHLLNREARRRAGWEGLTGIRFGSAWVDTHHQPCDSGTRLNAAGILSIERPLEYRARLVVEVFAGVGGVSAACRQSGLDVSEAWDIVYGVRFDLTRARNRRRLFRLLSSGHVFLVWWGTPCTTFSVARAPLRDALDPSKPRPDLSERDLAQFWDGTVLAEVTAQGLIVAHLAGAYSVVENPFSSGLWRFPPIEQALQAINAVYVRTVYCAWGEAWVKPTGLAGTLPGLEQLATDCCLRGGQCQHSGRAHIKLRGRAPNGQWWTKVAEPYPASFCRAVADLIVTQRDLAGAGQAQ